MSGILIDPVLPVLRGMCPIALEGAVTPFSMGFPAPPGSLPIVLLKGT